MITNRTISDFFHALPIEARVIRLRQEYAQARIGLIRALGAFEASEGIGGTVMFNAIVDASEYVKSTSKALVAAVFEAEQVNSLIRT